MSAVSGMADNPSGDSRLYVSLFCRHLPCPIYSCIQSSWPQYSTSSTRVTPVVYSLHESSLRESSLEPHPSRATFRPSISISPRMKLPLWLPGEGNPCLATSGPSSPSHSEYLCCRPSRELGGCSIAEEVLGMMLVEGLPR